MPIEKTSTLTFSPHWFITILKFYVSHPSAHPMQVCLCFKTPYLRAVGTKSKHSVLQRQDLTLMRTKLQEL